MTATPPSVSGTPLHQAPLYHEEQRFRQWWIWVLLVFPAGLAWWPFMSQVIGGDSVGQNPAPNWAIVLIWLAIGVGLPLLFGYAGLVLEVTSSEVRIHFRPFSRRTIPLGAIERVEARTYEAVREYGGWGIKGWSKDKVAYNVSGNRGVELTLHDGRRVMLGSQRADELAAVIESARRG